MDSPAPFDANALLERVARSRDSDAFLALFRHFAPRIKGWLIAGGTTPDLAEDTTQDVMLRVWRRAESSRTWIDATPSTP